MDAKVIKPVSFAMEARYPVNLSLLSTFGDFQKKNKNEFPYIIHNPYQVTLMKYQQNVQEEKDENIYLSTANLGVIDNVSTENEAFRKRSVELIRYAENNGVSTIDRIGVRCNYIIPIVDLQGDTQFFLERLFGKNALGQLGNSVGNMDLGIESIKDGIHNRLKSSFVVKATSTPSLPEKGLMIDVDCSKEELTVEDSITFMNEVLNHSFKLTKNFLHNFLIRGVR